MLHYSAQQNPLFDHELKQRLVHLSIPRVFALPNQALSLLTPCLCVQCMYSTLDQTLTVLSCVAFVRHDRPQSLARVGEV